MLLKSLFLLAGAQFVFAKCKCTPADDCWPSASKWNSLNSTVEGKLVQNQPLAKACYHGPGYSAKKCQRIASNWTNEFWIPESPIGYSYPLVDTCPPINASVAAYPSCELGTSPAYTIKATNADDVAAGIKFAKENNVRLVIKNTGHDISQRSQGYGSLSIWIKHVKDGLHFHKKFHYSEGSCPSNWTGSAITIGGGYVWKDAYDLASKHRHVVVGGGDPTVGCIGGFLQGAGHGSLSHEFGLATDQVLEYKVILASGETVTANACQNTDLFTALRGGGGGTYGVVLSATVKTYPTRPTLYHDLTIAALGHNTSAVLEATARMASKYPAIVDEGFAGTAALTRKYGPWVYGSPFIKFLANDSIEAINHAKDVMNREIINDLLPGNGTDYLVSSKWSTHPSWAAWYASTHHTSAGNSQPLMASRFFKKESLSGKEQELFDLLQILTTEVGAGVHTATSTVLLNIVAGGKVLNNVPYTSVNPAWREAYLVLQGIDMWPANAGSEEIQKVKEELTKRKLGAMKNLAPGTGTYVNEADPYDPDWKQDWFGDRYDQLLSIKKKYDPEDVFWCWRCVGNEGWEEVTGGALFGPLCQVN
ncbi:FAD-binding domain-containing protein [Mytilinidion resinicola]|uniref:FAD-binding domain-containing protein n=1 Tax=Mytilinidion resinicola TaxID=574789 RepID=A0A6A6Y3T8_9PEZI|nr:FAD-binding domain-containing protein [Mytilinidion resinicola]KAF2803188.1 FAD-binding domain-containing protein [Mytilinidion resinicola]